MNTKDDGGPAFPDGTGAILRRNGALDETHGMTLRDYFAAKAMAALIVAPLTEWPELDEDSRRISAAAYEIADAMLKERAK